MTSNTPRRTQTEPDGRARPGLTNVSSPISDRQQVISSPIRTHQNFAFTDTVAFRYLEEDPSTFVVSRRSKITGFAVYIVEKWACSRENATFVINTYTGDPTHEAIVGVLSIPTDVNLWSERMRFYFDATFNCYHARQQSTPVGMLMVTNLSNFPSDLTLVEVPDGDLRKHRLDFIVNEDLKRLGCLGRAGFTLQEPSAAAAAKFYQLYKVSKAIPLYEAVMELVKQCQMALTIFDMLGKSYVDGILCDVTERAIGNWWTDIGVDFYNIEPSDGILGPTTVAALLGTLMGARNRLNAYGTPAPKDIFDGPVMKKAIGHFQKSQKMEKTRRLDRQTLDKLHRATAKAASGEGWAVPRVVKSTVAELGGKGGEMVMDMMTGREKAGIAEVETLDIEQFAQLVSGDRSKWLWQGKPRKTGNDVRHNDDEERDIWDYVVPNGKTIETPPSRQSVDDLFRQHVDVSNLFDDAQFKLASKKFVPGKIPGPRAGLGRIRHVVPGLRSHHHKSSKETVDAEPNQLLQNTTSETSNSREGPNDSIGYVGSLEAPMDLVDTREIGPINSGSRQRTRESIEQPLHPESTREGAVPIPTSKISNSIPETPELLENQKRVTARYAYRSHSSDPLKSKLPPEARWCRRLSFGVAEEAILSWDPIDDWEPVEDNEPLHDQMKRENFMDYTLGRIDSKLQELNELLAPWMNEQVAASERTECHIESHLTEISKLYQEKLQVFRSVQGEASELWSRDGMFLENEVRKLELLEAKLDYTLNTLQTKLDEAEQGIDDYEKQVIAIEARLEEITHEQNRRSWLSWLFPWWIWPRLWPFDWPFRPTAPTIYSRTD